MYRPVVTICTAQWSLYVPHSGHYMYRPVVTICTAQWSLYVQHSGHYMYHQFNIHNSTFCPHSCTSIYVFSVDLRTNSHYFPIEYLIWLDKREMAEGNHESCYNTHRCCYHYVIGSCNRPFSPVLLLKQEWSPPLRLQVSHCSTSCIMCDVPSTAVFGSEIIIIIIIIIISAQNRKCAAVKFFTGSSRSSCCR